MSLLELLPLDIFLPILEYLCYVDQMAFVSSCKRFFGSYQRQWKQRIRQLLFKRITDSFNELVGCTDTSECNAALEVFKFMGENECMLSGSFILSCLYDKSMFRPNDIDLYIIADPDKHYAKFIYNECSGNPPINATNCDYYSENNIFHFMRQTINKIIEPLKHLFEQQQDYANSDSDIYNDYQYCPVKIISKQLTFKKKVRSIDRVLDVDAFRNYSTGVTDWQAFKLYLEGIQYESRPNVALQINVVFRSFTTELLGRLLLAENINRSITCNPIATVRSGCCDLEDLLEKTFDFDICRNAFRIHNATKQSSTSSSSITQTPDFSICIVNIQALFTRTCTLKLDSINNNLLRLPMSNDQYTSQIGRLYHRYQTYLARSFHFDFQIGDKLYRSILLSTKFPAPSYVYYFPVYDIEKSKELKNAVQQVEDVDHINNQTRVDNFHQFCREIIMPNFNPKPKPITWKCDWRVADFVLLPKIDPRMPTITPPTKKRQKMK